MAVPARLPLGFLLLTLLSACAAPPPRPGQVIRAEVLWTHRAEGAAVPPLRGPALDQGALDVARREGRLLRLRCAAGAETVFLADAVAEASGAHPPGSVVRVALGEPNRVLDALPGLTPSVPRNWTGRNFQVLPWSATPIEGPAPAGIERDHAPLRGQFLLRCTPSG